VIEKLETPDDWMKKTSQISQADVIIEFSTPGSVIGNIRNCFDLHLPVVVGTTGWNDYREQVKEWCLSKKQAIFAASNFSIGVNILFGLVGQLSAALDRFDDYDISLEEIHHIHKLDSPSGTAISLADIILRNVQRKERWVNRKQLSPAELEIISKREGEVPGIHRVVCESGTDRLSLMHEAKSRQGFAVGAVLAAEWLPGRQGFFSMEDMLLNKE
jgi:4-hydroxy-tetrahydrodipicolinate reductase